MPTTLPIRSDMRRNAPGLSLWILVLLLTIAACEAIVVSDTIARVTPAMTVVAGP